MGEPIRIKTARRARLVPVMLALVTSFANPARGQDLQLSLYPDSVFQTLDNFGSSAGFELNEITEAWRPSALDTLAALLFSTDTAADGSLKGIGLSGFRVELGACSHDNGDTSRISRVTARSHCPLRADGSYDWTKMDAETWWVRTAHAYHVNTVQAYSNSPPIHLTRNGLACRTQTQYVSNLRPDAYGLFADYLARIARHYDSLGTPLKYISPVNEPQWDWNCATNTQEGTQWSTQEISRLADSASSAFVRHGVSTNILLTEAGQLDFVYSRTSPNNDNNPSLDQLRLWAPGNALYIGNRPKIAPILAAHSYWTDDSDSRIFNIRTNLARALRDTNPELRYWQSEYSFLGNGYRDLSGNQNPTPHEMGLTLAKIIHADLVIGNTVAWQWWETFESTTNLPRYRLVQVDRDAQTAVPEKTYWALGHYSRFIRPGMRRIHVQRSDGLAPQQVLRDVMPTAFHDPATGMVTVVLVNYRADARTVALALPTAGQGTRMRRAYVSTPDQNMVPQPPAPLDSLLTVPARSLVTVVFPSGVVTAAKALPGSGKGHKGQGGVGGDGARRGLPYHIRKTGSGYRLEVLPGGPVATQVAGTGRDRLVLSDLQGRAVYSVETARVVRGHTIEVSLRPGVYVLGHQRDGVMIAASPVMLD